MKAIPKSQFVRIHRICTFTSEYWKYANIFINIFIKWLQKALLKIATEISNIDRRTQMKPLVIAWHHQIQSTFKVIHSSYSAVAKKFPEFRNVSKEPPIVAYRRLKHLSSYLFKNRYIPTKNSTPKEQCKSKTMINRYMNPLTTTSNQVSKLTCAIKGGKPTDKSVAYAAECMKHKLIYIGQTGDQCNNRFNRHKSDIKCYQDSCKLSRHFHSNDCNLEKDLKIPILEKSIRFRS